MLVRLVEFMIALLYLPFLEFSAHLLARLARFSSTPYGGLGLHSMAVSFHYYAGLAS